MSDLEAGADKGALGLQEVDTSENMYVYVWLESKYKLSQITVTNISDHNLFCDQRKYNNISQGLLVGSDNQK
jgi:hypothetical protein